MVTQFCNTKNFITTKLLDHKTSQNVSLGLITRPLKTSQAITIYGYTILYTKTHKNFITTKLLDHKTSQNVSLGLITRPLKPSRAITIYGYISCFSNVVAKGYTKTLHKNFITIKLLDHKTSQNVSLGLITRPLKPSQAITIYG